MRLEELRQRLLSRGYKPGQLRKAIEYGMALDREKTLEKVEREDKNVGRIRYTITYDQKLPLLPAILKNMGSYGGYRPQTNKSLPKTTNGLFK